MRTPARGLAVAQIFFLQATMGDYCCCIRTAPWVIESGGGRRERRRVLGSRIYSGRAFLLDGADGHHGCRRSWQGERREERKEMVRVWGNSRSLPVLILRGARSAVRLPPTARIFSGWIRPRRASEMLAQAHVGRGCARHERLGCFSA
jgi:hypothetical protein